MKTIKRILIIYKKSLIITFSVVAGLAVIGNIVHDIIVRTVPDEDMTVFPVGFILALFGIFIVVFVQSLNESNVFFGIISFGETRHRFFSDLVINRLAMVLGSGILVLLCYFLENAKFKVLFSSYAIDPDDAELLSLLGSPLFLILFCLGLFAISLLLSALFMRFGMAVLFVLTILYVIIIFSFTFEMVNAPLAKTFSEVVPVWAVIAGIVVIFAAAFFAARALILRQQVR